MSECTNVYIRHKEGKEVPRFKTYSFDPKLSDEEQLLKQKEIEEENKRIEKELGICLFTLYTTPSRELYCIRYSPNNQPELLTESVLQECIDFYKGEIELFQKSIKDNQEKISMLEKRILNIKEPTIYQAISDEIDDYNSNIKECEQIIDDYQYYKNKFDFVQAILDDNPNEYELIYTKW